LVPYPSAGRPHLARPAMARLLRVLPTIPLLGAAAPVASQGPLGDEMALLQMHMPTPDPWVQAARKYTPNKETMQQLAAIGNQSISQGTWQAMKDVVNAYFGDSKGDKPQRPRGMENLTDYDYNMILHQPDFEMVQHKFGLSSPEKVMEAALAAHGLMMRTGQKWSKMMSEVKAEEARDQQAWQERLANIGSTTAPAAAAGPPARSGPALGELVGRAGEILAGKRPLPTLAPWRPLPLSRLAASLTQPQAAWAPSPMAMQPQMQQWQSPVAATWGAAPPMQAGQSMPYGQAMQYGQPMPYGQPMQYGQAMQYGQTMQPMLYGQPMPYPQPMQYGQPVQYGQPTQAVGPAMPPQGVQSFAPTQGGPQR